MIGGADDAGIIYLRLSDFRDEDDAGAWTARADELTRLAADLGLHVRREAIENDLDGNGRARGASGYKTPERVATATGLMTYRTRRPVYQGVMLDLQSGAAQVLLVSDESRISRDWRDGMDLLDACQARGASCVALDDDGGARWVLTKGGTRAEREAFLDRINDARKYSADIGAKVRKGRRRWAGRSWQGGRRPFGFQIAERTDEHHRNLVKDDAEAAELVKAATALLTGTSLRWIIADLRSRGVPTVTGAPWSTRTLRDALMKPATAGLAVKGADLVAAPWPEILDRDTWEALRVLLTDPARRTNLGRGNEPRWLVSVFATCGVCGGLLRIGGAGRGRAPAYVGQACGHVRRDAAAVDALVTDATIGVLERPEVLERLRPPARPGVDLPAIRAKLDGLERQAERHRGANLAGRLADEDLYPMLAGLREQQAALREQLAASSTEPDLFARFREEPARVVWESLTIPQRRAVVQRLFESVVIEQTGRGFRFDPEKVILTPRADLAD